MVCGGRNVMMAEEGGVVVVVVKVNGSGVM